MRYWGNRLKNIIIFILVVPTILFAYIDSDLDGVSDEHDLCPDSKITDIVDKSGCVVERLTIPIKNLQHFDIIIGANYTNKGESSFNQSFQIDYYLKDFSLQLQTASYEDDGMGDTLLNLYYNFKPISKLSLRIGGGAIFPTYESKLENNNIDYKASFSINYKINNSYIFGGVGYTLVNDDDINSSRYRVSYQNSRSYYMGFGSYFIKKLYSSLIYSSNSSRYKGGDDIKNISIYNYFNIDRNWFTNFGYSRAINSNSLNQIYINLGYYF